MTDFRGANSIYSKYIYLFFYIYVTLSRPLARTPALRPRTREGMCDSFRRRIRFPLPFGCPQPLLAVARTRVRRLRRHIDLTAKSFYTSFHGKEIRINTTETIVAELLTLKQAAELCCCFGSHALGMGDRGHQPASPEDRQGHGPLLAAEYLAWIAGGCKPLNATPAE